MNSKAWEMYSKKKVQMTRRISLGNFRKHRKKRITSKLEMDKTMIRILMNIQMEFRMKQMKLNRKKR
jgi:hypothetical protein